MLVCPECASAIAPGRFACTSCGALVASVASAPRTLGWVEDLAVPVVTPPPPVEQPEAAEPAAPDPIEPTDAHTTIGPAWAHGPLERAPGETDLDIDDLPLGIDTAGPAPAPDGPLAGVLAGRAVRTRAPRTRGSRATVGLKVNDSPVEAVTVPTDQIVTAPVEAVAEPAEAEPVESEAQLADATVPVPAPEPSWPETRGWPPAGAAQPVFGPEPVQPPRAGAYLPPSAVLTTVDEMRMASAAAGNGSGSVSGHASVPDAVVPMEPSKREPLALPALDPTLPPRVAVIGAGIAGLGFLLPWAAVVIGSGRIGGYLEQWGLAGPGHPIVLLVLVALAAAAWQVERLPAWARPGLPSVVVASLLVGLVWPYLFGNLQPSVGLFLTFVGAIVLGAAGVLDLWATRHGVESPAV